MSTAASGNGLPEISPEKEPVPSLSAFERIEYASKELLPAVDAAILRDCKLKQFETKQDTKEVNLLAHEVVDGDVLRADKEVKNAMGKIDKINEAAIVVNLEMPNDVDMSLTFETQEELIDFLMKYKQVTGGSTVA